LLPESFEEDKGIIKLLIAVFDAPFLLTRKTAIESAWDTNAKKFSNFNRIYRML
jgi:hypothetical protein